MSQPPLLVRPQRVPGLLRRIVGKQGAEQFLGNIDAVLVGNVEAQLDRHADLETHGFEPCRTKDQMMALRGRDERP